MRHGADDVESAPALLLNALRPLREDMALTDYYGKVVTFGQGATVDELLALLMTLDGKLTVFSCGVVNDPKTGKQLCNLGFTNYPPPEDGVVRFKAWPC